MLATIFLVKSFDNNNFAHGTAFSKTEVIQAAFVGLVVLGEAVTVNLIAGILVSLLGVFGLIGWRELRQTSVGSMSRTALWGLLAGTGFAVSAVAYRGASLALGGEETNMVVRAATTLVWVLTFQTLAMGATLWRAHQSEFRQVLINWRVGFSVGLAGMLASAGWFSALAMQNAASVRALGQFELVFAVLTSTLIFREHITRTEILSISLIVVGILAIITN